MAETSKRPAEGDRDQFGTRESNRLQALADQTAETARQIGDKGGNAFRSAAYTAADATQRAGDVAANTMSSAAEQGRDAVMSGLRAIAGAQGPLADVGFEQSRRALETTSQITDTYRAEVTHRPGDHLAGSPHGERIAVPRRDAVEWPKRQPGHNRNLERPLHVDRGKARNAILAANRSLQHHMSSAMAAKAANSDRAP